MNKGGDSLNYKVLYRKYRPQTFDDVTGQTYVIKTLKNAIINNKISHAYIFTGPRGTGKTSVAKIFAKSINCEHQVNGNPCLKCTSCQNFKENPDIIEIDAASNNGVDEIRMLIDNVKLSPSNSKYKVYIIDEVHMLSQSAFNALLLTLEEPPSHVVFILATTDIQNVPVTILSRTQRFDFTRIDINDIIKRLKEVCKIEKIKISEDALKEIAMLSDGGLRDALSILDQLSSQTTNLIDLETVQNTFGTISNKIIKELIEKMLSDDVSSVLDILHKLKNSSIDSKIIILKLIEELKNLAIEIKLGNQKENNLSFNTIKQIILELNNSFIKSIGTDPYIIIKIILLRYMKNKDDTLKKTALNITYFPGNKTTNLANDTHAPEIENANNQISIKRTIELKNIRVNNCFVSADKKYLEIVRNVWDKYIKQLKIDNDSLFLNLIDTQVVAASEQYCIIQTTSTSSSGLINAELDKIENQLIKLYNFNYKIIALSVEEWNESKKEFINHKKNKITYKYISETEKSSDDDNINLVTNIFDKSKIIIEEE